MRKTDRVAVNDKNAVRDELTAIILQNHASLTAAAKAGAKAGLDSVLKQLANPLSLTKGLRGTSVSKRSRRCSLAGTC